MRTWSPSRMRGASRCFGADDRMAIARADHLLIVRSSRVMIRSHHRSRSHDAMIASTISTNDGGNINERFCVPHLASNYVWHQTHFTMAKKAAKKATKKAAKKGAKKATKKAAKKKKK